jgi:DNA invertase Pin-like site-specific DNA recombinase
MGVSVAAIFSDLATRGTTSKRKGWDEMWRFCEEHKNTQIAIESMSRATRNGIAYAEWIHNRVRVGATIHSVSNGGPLTEFQEQLFSAIANHDYISATTQMRNQKILAAERGVYMGKAPYGTFKDKEKLLHPDPETAPIVKEIFEWAASGYRIVDIVNMLQARNILGPNGRLLDRDIVIYILQNTAYKGLALFTPPVFEFERRSFDYIFER